VPYRLDLPGASVGAFDRVVDLGALDAEYTDEGGLAALMPDSVDAARVARSLGVGDFRISPAIGRDAGSTWVLRPREVRVGKLRIVPSSAPADPGTLRLVDSGAFGTGLHPTTALCLDAIQDIIGIATPDAMLDVGTGSGVLALAALTMGVPRALGIDADEEALPVAAANARLNELGERMQLVRGGPEAIAGTWPLVVANILAAPLIEMAPALVQRVGHRGQIVLSGIRASVEQEVAHAYRHRGMHPASAASRDGWSALVLRAAW
jgi:ribosomal protein L11 methyltransferase